MTKKVRLNNEVAVLPDGSEYTYADVVTAIATASTVNTGGITSARPVAPVLYQTFFDATLGYLIAFDGTNWVDATGLTV